MLHRKIRNLIVLLLSSCCVSMQAQDVLVTFYSHGSIWKSGIPGTKQDIYYGNIFDGRQRIFAFRDSFFVHNNRYITLRLTAGPHTFGASNGKRPEERETLRVDLQPDHRYFIRAQGESKGVPGMFEIQHGRLDLMSCNEALKEMADAKQLNAKALSKEMKPRQDELLYDEASLPPCP